MLKTALLSTLLVAAMSQAAFAGGLKLNAEVTQTTAHVGSHFDMAIGKGAVAKSRIGSISGSTIDATVDQTTLVLGTTSTLALGDNARATMAIGSIHGVEVAAPVTQFTVANNVATIAGPDAEACTGIGIIGELPDCTK